MAGAEIAVAAQLNRLRWRHASARALALALLFVPTLVLFHFRFGWSQTEWLLWLLVPAGLALLALLAFWHGWQQAGRLLPRWLDDRIAALQDSSYLLQSEANSSLARLQQQRVRKLLQAHLAELPTVLPAPLPRSVYGVAVLANVMLALALWWPATPVAPNNAATTAPAATPVTPELRLRITPPAYTGLAAYQIGASDALIPDGSTLQFCLLAPADAMTTISVQWLDGETRALEAIAQAEHSATANTAHCSEWQFSFSTGYKVLRGGEPLADLQGRLRLQADMPPVLTIKQPERDLQEVDSAEFVLSLALQLEDDYRLQRASLHWTLARGGGENVRFTDREQRLPVGTDPRRWQHQQQIRLRDLGMEPGDELYFYLTAEDNRQPARQQSRSRTYVLRHPVETEAMAAGARLPADLGKAKFRSQRQIIIDTEALISQRKSLSEKIFRERSEKLAQDQMVLRLRYGEFLGEESSFEAAEPEKKKADDEHEDHADAEAAGGHDDHVGHADASGMAPVGIAARSQMNVLSAYGHAHDEAENATLFDEATKTVLRRALRAMWSAEGGLRMSEPEQALPHEYSALAAIKELQQAERIYLHKTAFSPPPLEDSMRFSGEATDLRNLQRQHKPLQSEIASLLTRLVAALDQTESAATAMASAAVSADDVAALRRWLQAQLRQAHDNERALLGLEHLQQWQSGCRDCQQALRDHLLGYLPTPLAGIAPQPVADRRLQDLLQSQTVQNQTVENQVLQSQSQATPAQTVPTKDTSAGQASP